MKSTFLDHCWVCSIRFIDSTPPGPGIKNNHHIVPCAYGGVDGPQVTLCDSCHNTLHQIAVTWKSGKSHFKYIQNKPTELRKKLEYLSSVVYNAELASRGDANKLASVLLHLNHKQRTQLDSLKKVYSKRNRQQILYIALEHLFNKHFTQ